MGILNRWRQLGRRYFWPHLLLGVVAASLGLSNHVPSVAQTNTPTLLTRFASLNHLSHVHRTDIMPELWQTLHRQASQPFNPWQKQAIRRLLTRLALTLPPISAHSLEQNQQYADHLLYSQWALFDTLALLLSDNFNIISAPAFVHSSIVTEIVQQKIGLWLAITLGIRAGPHFYG